jgi:hypothetical protein
VGLRPGRAWAPDDDRLGLLFEVDCTCCEVLNTADRVIAELRPAPLAPRGWALWPEVAEDGGSIQV